VYLGGGEGELPQQLAASPKDIALFLRYQLEMTILFSANTKQKFARCSQNLDEGYNTKTEHLDKRLLDQNLGAGGRIKCGGMRNISMHYQFCKLQMN